MVGDPGYGEGVLDDTMNEGTQLSMRVVRDEAIKVPMKEKG